MKIIENIIPIILIASVVLYPENTAHFTNSILGRIVAVMLIVYYASHNIIYGVVICVLIVLYKRNIQYHEGFENAKELFREQNCKNGELKYKNLPVKTDMAQHIFPELNYQNSPCNPCDPVCDFSILEEKMKNEEHLIAPKNSNDWMSEVWSKMTNVSSNPVPVSNNTKEYFAVIL